MSFLLTHMPNAHIHITHMHAVAACIGCFLTGTAFGWTTCAICTAAKRGFNVHG